MTKYLTYKETIKKIVTYHKCFSLYPNGQDLKTVCAMITVLFGINTKKVFEDIVKELEN